MLEFKKKKFIKVNANAVTNFSGTNDQHLEKKLSHV